jgi:hypothetical protein
MCAGAAFLAFGLSAPGEQVDLIQAIARLALSTF